MHTKLKLKIDLFTDYMSDNDPFGVKQIGFFIKLTILEKDERFELSEKTGDYIRFRGEYFYVKIVKNKKFGGLFDEGIILPHLDKTGYAYTKFFNTDNDRYEYLKKLYKTLDEWCLFWWGFENDSPSKIIIDGDTWEVVCATIKKEIEIEIF